MLPATAEHGLVALHGEAASDHLVEQVIPEVLKCPTMQRGLAIISTIW